MKITVEGEQSEILSLKKELAAILRAESAGNPVEGESCPCGEDDCPGEKGYSDPEEIIDDLKDQIRSLESSKAQLAEDLSTWKAAAANNYELYLRTVKEAEEENDKLAEELKRLEACRDACVEARMYWNGSPPYHQYAYLKIWDAAEPFMKPEGGANQ